MGDIVRATPGQPGSKKHKDKGKDKGSSDLHRPVDT